ncbi:diguanylate cyclase [Duganella sp. SAP-35]|uniref:Diguanylate cyclase n=2 Tax=Duganella aceris TaxID=2703883 RepID=A0ABX0FR64_9BURK|nr:diguanylate cyclase [Duganella aceris]
MAGVVVMLVLIATIVVTWVALVLAERDMKSIIGDQQYALLSAAAAQVDAQMSAKKVLLASLADSMPADAGLDTARMKVFIDRHPSVRREFLNVHIFNRQGMLINTAGDQTAALELDARVRAYLERVLAAGKPVVTPPFKSLLTGLPAIMILHPVLDAGGRPAMLLGGSIDLTNSSFLEQIAAQKPGKTGFTFIMTTRGTLVHHPNPTRLLENINARPGHNRATEMALQGFEGWTEAANKDGSEGIYSYKRLKSTNWIIGSRFPVDEAFAPMIVMRRHAMLASAAFAAVAGLLAWIAIQVLLRPLGRLRRNISDIRNGVADIGVLQRRRRDEIGELGSAFHELISERESAQQAIRDSEALIAASEKRLRTIADSLPALVAYLDRDLRYGFSNEHFRTMMGVDPQAMLGKTIEEVFGKEFNDSLAEHNQAALRGEHVHYERQGHHQGAPRQVMGDMIPEIAADGSVSGYYLMALDITERKSAELRQAASEKRLKLLTDNLPVLISYLDKERKFQFVNATFQHWFGLDPATLLGRHLMDGIGHDNYYTAEPHLDKAYGGQIATYELKTRIGDSLHTLETTFVPDLAPDGGVAGIYSLTHDTTRLKEIEERLTQLARIDTLTGIANRLMFEEMLQLAMVRAKRNRKPLALAYLDIDRFKEINDTLGHGAGDAVLKEFATRLVDNVRAADTVARLAGDEFIIIFEQVANTAEAGRLAAKIIEGMGAPFEVAGSPRRITTSIGLALYRGDEEALCDLVARADGALYAAKRNGRDGYAIAD